MSKIAEAFKQGKAFIGFVTGGDPTLEKTEEFILEMVRAGVDLVEIGIPFSDPIAEGVVIQDANIRALAAGAAVPKIFDLVASVRKCTNVPLVFMTYLNPVFNYGYDSFFKKCAEVGVDGIIIPDLPFEEKREVSEVADGFGVDVISLIAPTSEHRIQQIAQDAKGFIYLVSSMGVTGVRNEIKTNLAGIIEIVRASASLPVAVGFGVNTTEQAAEISKSADGVIVGSAIVAIIEKYGEKAGPYVYDYVKKMKDALSQ